MSIKVEGQGGVVFSGGRKLWANANRYSNGTVVVGHFVHFGLGFAQSMVLRVRRGANSALQCDLGYQKSSVLSRLFESKAKASLPLLSVIYSLANVWHVAIYLLSGKRDR